MSSIQVVFAYANYCTKEKKIIIDILIIDFELTNSSKKFNSRLHKIFMLIVKKDFSVHL